MLVGKHPEGRRIRARLKDPQIQTLCLRADGLCREEGCSGPRKAVVSNPEASVFVGPLAAAKNPEETLPGSRRRRGSRRSGFHSRSELREARVRRGAGRGGARPGAGLAQSWAGPGRGIPIPGAGASQAPGGCEGRACALCQRVLFGLVLPGTQPSPGEGGVVKGIALNRPPVFRAPCSQWAVNNGFGACAQRGFAERTCADTQARWPGRSRPAVSALGLAAWG